MSAGAWEKLSVEYREVDVFSTCVEDLYPLRSFAFLFSSCRLLVSMTLLCRELSGLTTDCVGNHLLLLGLMLTPNTFF